MELKRPQALMSPGKTDRMVPPNTNDEELYLGHELRSKF
jgi:hypothetical protein